MTRLDASLLRRPVIRQAGPLDLVEEHQAPDGAITRVYLDRRPGHDGARYCRIVRRVNGRWRNVRQIAI